MSVVTDILWWPAVAVREVSSGQKNALLAVGGAAAASYYFLGLPSISDGLSGFAIPYVGWGVALYGANMIAGLPVSGGPVASMSY